jgi:SAM-dependent methyltransferase
MNIPWYTSWFESPWYMRLYRNRSEEEARQAISLVRHVARIPLGASVLDLCCGYGRHAHALSEEGYVVTGLDSSRFLIDRAQELYPHANTHYVVGDMRKPYPNAPFTAIVNFFTSFGYFDTHDENADVLKRVFASLIEGGVFVFDFFNSTMIRKTLEHESMLRFDDVTVYIERSIQEPFVKKVITIADPCSYEQEFFEQVWLYSPSELRTMLEEAGFIIDHHIGTYAGVPFDEANHSRCVYIARKPRV